MDVSYAKIGLLKMNKNQWRLRYNQNIERDKEIDCNFLNVSSFFFDVQYQIDVQHM